jgi:hypothetical protein
MRSFSQQPWLIHLLRHNQGHRKMESGTHIQSAFQTNHALHQLGQPFGDS